MKRRLKLNVKTNIFIPEKIKVGFQDRSDTYTKKLAYVIYYDQKGVLRKEASWNSWRDKKIQDVDILNVPTSGLVLNKKVGGYSSGWDHRQTYVRVYDPRDFEFEITVANLLYILENTSSIKGKGLDGEFVYAWDGKDLLLIPTESPDYIEMTNFNKIIHEKNYVKAKDLILGATYRAKDNEEWIYMGRFDCHTTKSERVYDSRSSVSYIYHDVNKGKHHFFLKETKYSGSDKVYLNMLTLKSLGEKFIGTVSLDCVENYAELFGQLEHRTEYSPYDESKDEYIVYDYAKFVGKIIKVGWTTTFYTNDILGVIKIKLTPHQNGYKEDSIYEVFTETTERGYHWNREVTQFKGTLKEIHDKYQPSYKNKYLTNGNLHQKGE